MRARWWLVSLALGAVLMLAGCSGSGDAAVTAAQAKVTQAEAALADAQKAAQGAHDQFCSASASYITALDRYGDVLTQTATTVGDVKTAGGDLSRPQQSAMDAGAAAVEAQRAVVSAEQDLVTAEVRLDQLTASATPSPSASTKTSATPTPAASAAVSRVTAAEDAFASAMRGVTDATPLHTASEQFNAAVVSLEFAWLQLFSDAGCLAGDQQKQAAMLVHDYTARLQEALTTAGYYTGEVDGVYGPAVTDAVSALQKAHGLPVTGTVDAATEAALTADVAAKGGAVASESIASTAAVQQSLKLAGYWDGPVDGKWTPALTEALKKAQTALGVPASGAVDAATLAAWEKGLAAAASGSPAPTVTVTSTATATATVTASPSPSGSG